MSKRDWHETRIDRIAEDAIAQTWIDKVWPGLLYNKIPSGLGLNYSFDFCFHKPESDITCAVAEVKDRHQSYKEIILGAAKAHQLMECEIVGMPAYFIVRLPKIGVHYIRVKPHRFDKYTIKIGGRTDRGEELDRERCYYIPLKDFHRCSRKQ